MSILNLTQHVGTPEQGVREPLDKREVQELLTFNELPSIDEVRERARKLAFIAAGEGAKKAMIGGAPYLMPALEFELIKRSVTPVYAFSERQVVETVGDGGEVVKKSVFKHVGFVESPTNEVYKDIYNMYTLRS